MGTQGRKLLRPEDATSLEEFQARRVIAQAQCRALNSSWAAIGQTLLCSLLGFVDIFFWFVVATSSGPGFWLGLVFALIFGWLVLWCFGKVMRRGVRGSKRYLQLDRLSKDWQARADRGEIPRTSPGGPKVWRDELGEANTQGA
jgi:hypothetical protein